MWRIKDLIVKLGGAAEVHRQLQKLTDAPLTAGAIRNWSYRNSIPADWLARITILARMKWPDFNPADYLECP